jgi:mono/diheme cytochrome c family protein
MAARRKLLFGSAAVVAGIGAFVAIALIYRPAIAPITPPDPKSFTPPLVEEGADLAAIGDCAVCHTAEGGKPYAGGRALATPFGTLYATNITPDAKTGIGTWSKEAFRRAMREGVSRDGAHLYPALPYEHFTHVSDGDLEAIYAFLMTRPAVEAEAPRNKLIPPLGFRPLLAGWKLLFLHETPFMPTVHQSPEWNRGAYLVEGLGHCGGCHTPRNLAGGEEAGRAYAGGVAEGWIAPALDGSNPAVKAWTSDALYTYLRTGIDPQHSAAAGPMGPVTHDLSLVQDGDVHAIAAYIASRIGQNPSGTPVDQPDQALKAHPEGATLFAGACSSCHGTGAPMLQQGRPDLSLVSVLQEDEPADTIRIILQGLKPPLGNKGPAMPHFADNLTTHQVAEIAAYLRSRFSLRPAWPSLEQTVADARKEGGSE